MITFKLTFLLAFSIKNKSKKEKKDLEGREKAATKKKKGTEDEEKDPPYLIRLDKTFAAAHIEYELIPGKCKYQADVLCWSNAAKIFTSDGTKILTTVARNELTFVPVCIMHEIKEISTDELIALQGAVIEFNVYTDKAKLGSSAKANKTEIIYLRVLDCGKEGFLDGFPERLDVSTMSAKKSVKTYKTIDDDDVYHYMKNEARSQLNYEENFADTLYEIIDFQTNEDAPDDLIQFKDFVKAYNPNEEQGKKPASKKEATDKSSKKDVKKTEKATTKLTLQMQGEIFFTDPHMAIFKEVNHKCEVCMFFVVTQVDNLLTRSQKIHLNPIVIKTMHISNFPVEVFENTGFTSIYCKYSIPCIAECKTIEKPISKKIQFNESHIYFTHTLSKIKLLEFLESKRLILEIYGVEGYHPHKITPKLFGEKANDTDISKINTNFRRTCLSHEEYLRTQDLLLAFSSYDLSSLLKNVWDFREKGQVHNMDRSTFILNPNETKSDEALNCDFWAANRITVNGINLANIHESLNSDSISLLKEWMLIENTTTLSIEAYLLSPQAAALVLHQIPNTYKRLFMIAFQRTVAIDFFTKILRHNQTIICNKRMDTENLLTGWILDNGNNIAIYIEGIAVGYILNLWQDLNGYTLDQVKIFFNTDQAYEKRLYPMCSKWSGFFIVTLKVPLDYILKDRKLYVKGNAPLLCLKALTKLNLLFHTRTLKHMLQYDLFPNIEELESLDVEYGVPYAWKSHELTEEISFTDSKEIQIEDL